MQQLGNNRILVIDDNHAIHNDFRKILSSKETTSNLADAEALLFDDVAPVTEQTSFEIDSAFQGQEGLLKVQEALNQGRPYAMAFVDIRMPPGWDGIETLSKIWQEDPNLQAVICSAYSDYSWEDITGRLGQSDKLLILKKPFDNIEVTQLAHALTKKWSLNHELMLKLAENQRLMSTFFENTSEAILISDLQKQATAVNPAFTRLTGYSLTDLLESNENNEIADKFKENLSDHVVVEIHEQGHWQGEVTLPHKEKNTFPAWLHLNTIKDESNKIVNYLTLFSDITRLKEQQRQLEYLANYDGLTGLPNRTLFYDRLRHSLDRAKRRNKRNAVAFIDVDNFKYVNDTLGHDAGDILLRTVAERLKTAVRTEDTVCRITAKDSPENEMLCRFGGDEFALLLEDVTDPESVGKIMHRIVTAFNQGFIINGHQLFTTTSIGVAVFPDDGEDVETLLRHSDTAMYKTKEAGKNGYQFFTASMNQDASKRLFMEAKLRNALVNEEFFLVYQPQIEVLSTKVIGVEALIRWRDPEIGIVPPDQFIPIAELSGLINPIGQWVLRESCRQAREWLDSGINARVSVNLSAHQFQQKDLTAMVSEVLNEFALPATHLELELTESALMQDPANAAKILNELHAMGVTIAIDDFGTGYSSLTYLKRFPVDRIKIDRSFVRDILNDPDDAAIVTAVITLAHSLGIKVVAEGVETIEQLNYLRTKVCNEAQGYYFSRPVSPAEIPAFYKDQLTTKVA